MSADLVDNFAGGGGSSTGATQAGARVLAAANHWPLAVQVHALNHPETLHFTQDLHQMDWALYPRHDIQLASPSCQGHTHARGKDRPHHDKARSTAWAVVECATFHRPPFIAVENTPGLLRWIHFPSWRDCLERLGYALSVQILDAADCGVAQHRRRLWIVGAQSKAPLVLPKPAHPHVPASRFIQWTRGNWSRIDGKKRAARTLERIRNGRAMHGERFLVPFYGNEHGGRCVDRPIGTLTTHDRYMVVDGDRARMLMVEEQRDLMGFPSDYRLSGNHRDDTKLLGNAVPPPMARHVVASILEAA